MHSAVDFLRITDATRALTRGFFSPSLWMPIDERLVARCLPEINPAGGNVPLFATVEERITDQSGYGCVDRW